MRTGLNPDETGDIAMTEDPISEERLRNTRAWAFARLGSLSGAEVIVGAIDELLERREASRPREQDPLYEGPRDEFLDGGYRTT